MAKISKRAVDALQPDPSRDTFLWDDALGGFGVRCRPSGKKIYLLKYRAGGRQRWLTLGAHGVITADQARSRALHHKADVEDGADPSGEKQDRRREPTVADVADRYLAEHVAIHNKPSTEAEMRRLVGRRIKPALGGKRITDLARSDVAAWHHGMASTPYEGNRALACLSKMAGLAATIWELRPDNPCKGIPRFIEKPRVDGHLDDEKLRRLGKVLATVERDGSERPEAIHVIRLLATTGMRLGEACAIKWKDVDLDARTIRLQDAKAGPRTVHLGAAAVAVLAAAPGDRDGYLATAALDPDKPITPAAIEHVWARVRERAGLNAARIHDLRHTYGTLAALGGANAFVIRDLLGHKTLAMTNRYVGRAAELTRTAADQVAQRVANAFAAGGPQEGGEIVDMPQRRSR